MLSLDYSVPANLFKKGKPVGNKDISLAQAISGVLIGLHVPYQDDCCVMGDNRPVRTNAGGTLQTYVNGVWNTVTGTGYSFTQGTTQSGGIVRLGGSINVGFAISGSNNAALQFVFSDLLDKITIAGVDFFDIDAKVDFANKTLTDFVLDSKTVSATTYSLIASDSGRIINFTTNAGVVITIPAGLKVGFTVTLIPQGTGAITFDATAVTLHNRQSQFISAGRYAILSLFSTSSNTYILGGDTA